MNLPIRSILSLSILVIILAACGSTVAVPVSDAPSPTQPVATPTPEPSADPTTPADPAEEKRDTDGTLTVAEGMAFSGPGGTIAEALDAGTSGEFPALVNGVLFRDTDGTIYLATAVSDDGTFDGPMLEVLNMPNDGPSWDMANAELLSLEEANGIVFNRSAQVLGFLEIR